MVLGEDDFPAQQAATLHLASELRVRPAQVGLSLRRQGKRYAALGFVNGGEELAEVNLSVLPGCLASDDAVTIRPADLVLAPGPLPPGGYRFHAEIQIGEGRQPVVLEDSLRIGVNTTPGPDRLLRESSVE